MQQYKIQHKKKHQFLLAINPKNLYKAKKVFITLPWLYSYFSLRFEAISSYIEEVEPNQGYYLQTNISNSVKCPSLLNKPEISVRPFG